MPRVYRFAGTGAVEGLVRTLVVVNPHEVVESLLLLKEVNGGRLVASCFRVRCMRS